MSIKINKINWGQFGGRSVSVRTDRVSDQGAFLEILESDQYGNRYYPETYFVVPEDAHTVKDFHWGEAYIFLCNQLKTKGD
tara:strand:- start:843 stop:1085 length:243 start_codon:yes stop_codon:yes gene_type:complete